MRKLRLNRETLTILEKGELQQLVAASVSCPIVRLRDQVVALIGSDTRPPQTLPPTFCHCP